MTVASTPRRAGPFVTNGVQTAFPFAFKVFGEEDVLVTLSNSNTPLVYGVDYTVVLNDDQDFSPGGTVHMTVAPSGVSLALTSGVKVEQPVVVTNQGGFFPAVFNNVFDRQTIIAQQLAEKLDRALLVPPGSTGLVLPPLDERLDSVLGFDPSGNLDALPKSDFKGDKGDPGGSNGTFTQAGGGVVRDTEAKVREWIAPADYAGTFEAQFLAAVQQAALGGGQVHVPGGDYAVNGNLLVPYGIKNVTIYAHGCTFRNARLAIQGGYGFGDAQHINFFGGTITEESGSDADWLLDISGKDVLVRDTKFRCINSAGVVVPKPGYMGFFRVDVANNVRAERITLDNVEFDGTNGLLIAGNGHRIIRNSWKNASLYTSAFGGDDAVAIKAIGASSYDIEIADNTMEGYYSIASLGSEIGTNGADDPTYSIGISDIRVLRNRGLRCSSIGYVKPGAIGVIAPAYDYRNALLDKLLFEGNLLQDLSGERMLTPFAIHMGRGSKLVSLVLRNNEVRGRFVQGNASALNAVIQVMTRNLGTGSIIEDVEVDGLHFYDTTGNAAPSGTNGHRARYFLETDREHPTGGSIGRIRLNNITMNGASGCSVYVGQNITGPVIIGARDISGVATDPASAAVDAALVDNSGVVKVEGKGKLVPSSAATVAVKAAAGKKVAGDTATKSLGTVNATTTTFWTPPCDCYITGVSLTIDTALATSTTDYWGFTVRGNGLVTILNANTYTGDADNFGPLVAGVAKPMRTNMISSVDARVDASDKVQVDMTKVGAAPDLVGAVLTFHYVPLDRPVF